MALRPDSSLTPEEKRARALAAQEDVLLREVDDAVRQDQYADAAKRFGKPALVAVGLVSAALLAFTLWDMSQRSEREGDSEKLVSALDQVEGGNLAGGDAALATVISEGSEGTRAAARLLKAGIAMEQNKPTEAVALFDQVAADGDAPQAMRDIAAIRSVATRYDKMKPADVIARLKPLAVPGSPWFGSAGELVAMAYLDQGNQAEAGALFAAIAKDDDTSETLRARTRQMAGLLGVDAIEDVDTVLNESASPTP